MDIEAILEGIRDDCNEEEQITCLHELCNLLSIGGEEAMPQSVAEALMPLLLNCMRREDNFDIMLVSSRALSYLIDCVPSVGAQFNNLGGIAVITDKLLNIQFIDIAEQCLIIIDKLVVEHHYILIREGVLNAILTFIDFFNLATQREILTTASILCKRVSKNQFGNVVNCVPSLANMLQCKDAKIVENALLCYHRLLMNFLDDEEKCATICPPETLRTFIRLLDISQSETDSVSISLVFKILSALHKAGGSFLYLLFSLNTDKNESGEGNLIGIMSNLLKHYHEHTTAAHDATKQSGSPKSLEKTITAEVISEIIFFINNFIPKAPSGLVAALDDNRVDKDELPRLKLDGEHGHLLQELLQICVPLLNIYSVTQNNGSKYKVLNIVSNSLYIADGDQMGSVLGAFPFPKFISDLLLSHELPLTVYALIFTRQLLLKAKETYSVPLMREGVVSKIQLITQKTTNNYPPNVVEYANQLSEGLLKEVSILEDENSPSSQLKRISQTILQCSLHGVNDSQEIYGHIKELNRVLMHRDGISMYEFISSEIIASLMSYLFQESPTLTAEGEVLNAPESNTEKSPIKTSPMNNGVNTTSPTLAISSDMEKKPLGRKSKVSKAIPFLMINQESFSTLIGLLQQSLSHYECFSNNGSTPASLKLLMQPFKLILEPLYRPKDKTNTINILIEPMSNMSSVEDLITQKILNKQTPPVSEGDIILFVNEKQCNPTQNIFQIVYSIECGGNVEFEVDKKLWDIVYVVTYCTRQEHEKHSSSDKHSKDSAQCEAVRVSRVQQSTSSADVDPTLSISNINPTGIDGGLHTPIASSSASPAAFIPHLGVNDGTGTDTEGGDSDGVVIEGHTREHGDRSPNSPIAPELKKKEKKKRRIKNTDSHSPAGVTDTSEERVTPGEDRNGESPKDGETFAYPPPQPETPEKIIKLDENGSPARQIPSFQNQETAAFEYYNADNRIIPSNYNYFGSIVDGILQLDAVFEDNCQSVLGFCNKETLSCLKLLKFFYLVNQYYNDLITYASNSISLSEENIGQIKDFRGISSSQFLNAKISNKLNKQIQNPFLIISGLCGTIWFHEIISKYSFFFGTQTKHLYFELTSFGPSRALLKLQEKIKEIERVKVYKQKVRISRSHILESAMKIMNLYGNIKAFLEFEYFGEVGTGLGPTMEFYTLISRAIHMAKLGIWLSDRTVKGESENGEEEYVYREGGLYPLPAVQSEVSPEICKLFFFLGQFIARSLIDKRIIDVYFSVPLLKLLVGTPLCLSDMRYIDSDLHKFLEDCLLLVKQKHSALHKAEAMGVTGEAIHHQLNALALNGASLEDLCLYMTLPGNPKVELIDNGAEVSVTIYNIEEFIQKTVHFYLSEGINKQVTNLLDGINSIISVSSLKMFTLQELEEILTGNIQPITLSELEEYTICDHGYTHRSGAVQNLFSIVVDMSKEDLKKFIMFITGAPRLPIGGLRSLKPLLTIVRKTDVINNNNNLPSVMTCVNYLKLPNYETKEVMKEKLYLAMNEGAGSFHLS